ncbi:MAG: DUF4093 domain-containing protein [Oscillospiraceae bacterium]
MINTARAIIVEGRYDRVKLDTLTDATVITTDGFNIFRDKEKQALIKRLASEFGLIVLTDSDDAGFKIRKFVEDIAKKDNIINAYIPEIAGKEKRKSKSGAAGLIGVEGVSNDLLKKALMDALESDVGGHIAKGDEGARKIEIIDLFSDGLNGCSGARLKREKLLIAAGLPTRLSTNAMLELLNKLVGYEKYKNIMREIESNESKS